MTTQSEGITIVYSSDLEGFVNNAVVDYEDSWYERGFVLKGAGISSC